MKDTEGHTVIIFARSRPFPKCRHCGKEMDYWMPGLKDEDHAHTECAAKAAANYVIGEVKRAIRKR